MFDIRKDRLTSILGERKTRSFGRLTGYADRAPSPIDVIELHPDNVAGAQPKPGQQ